MPGPNPPRRKPPPTRWGPPPPPPKCAPPPCPPPPPGPRASAGEAASAIATHAAPKILSLVISILHELLWREQAAAANVPPLTGTCPKLHAQDYRIQQCRRRRSGADRTPRRLRLAQDLRLVIQHRVQKRAMDFDFSVVADQAEFAEFVHEETDAGAGGPDHLGQGFLTDVGSDRLRRAFFAEI